MTWRHNSAQLLRLIESQAETIAARGAQSDLRPYAPRGQQRWRRVRISRALQQVGEHPASRVAELTSLLKAHFAEDPLRSDLSQFSRC
jgi:hypothetical protein